MTKEEAIEIIKRNCTKGSQLMDACAMFIPELAESEDERMVRIIEDVICTNEGEIIAQKYGLKLTDLADWLEKQKDEAQRQYNLGVQAGREEALYETEKQKEQQFTHHEIDESLQDAVTHQMEDDGEVDDFVRRGIDDIALKYAELGASWQKEQKRDKGDFTIYHPLKNGKGEYECIPYSFYGSLTSFSEDKDLIDFLRTCFYKEEECKEWIEKQKEQKPEMIQWTGKNLKEVINFTGKSPRFGEWFKSWDDFENYVHAHNDILKLFCEDGIHYEVPVGAWIVKTPDGVNIPSLFRFVQKPAESGVVGRRGRRGLTPEPIRKKAEEFQSKMAPPYDADDICSAYETGAIEQKPVININHLKSYMLQYLQDAANRKDDGEIEADTDYWAKKILELMEVDHKPAEWSEEDEEIINSIICNLEYLLFDTPCSEKTKENLAKRIKWLGRLKSLRPQPHWKPSEEQISVFLKANPVNLMPEELSVYHSLCNDIQKLM